mmetsp:Transcript_21755/g.53728  ORF Transcript_21755/g.53728 Transcript_21755/m.53728 type:complete len:474 (+) Transcript_21755:1041-2462(+)
MSKSRVIMSSSLSDSTPPPLSSSPAGRPQLHLYTFSTALRSFRLPSTCAPHRASAASAAASAAAVAAAAASSQPACAASKFPAARDTSLFPRRVTWPRLPARIGPRTVATVCAAPVTTPITSHPPCSVRVSRCATSCGCPHSNTDVIMDSTWWCRKLLNGYCANNRQHTGSAPHSSTAAATVSWWLLSRVASKSTTLTRLSPSGGAMVPHVACIIAPSPSTSRNATNAGRNSRHPSSASRGAARAVGGSEHSIWRNACILCVDPAARLASITAMAMSRTFTSGLLDAPSCAVTAQPPPGSSPGALTDPPPPGTPSPYRDNAPPRPRKNNFRIESFPASFAASALGAQRAMPTNTSAALACWVASPRLLPPPTPPPPPSWLPALELPKASRRRSSSGVSASHALPSPPCTACNIIPCMDITPGSSAPTSRSNTSATASTRTWSTSLSKYCGWRCRNAMHSVWRRARRHPTVLEK